MLLGLTVRGWMKQFGEGRTHFEDEACSGRLSDTITGENIMQIRTLLNEDA